MYLKLIRKSGTEEKYNCTRKTAKKYVDFMMNNFVMDTYEIIVLYNSKGEQLEVLYDNNRKG